MHIVIARGLSTIIGTGQIYVVDQNGTIEAPCFLDGGMERFQATSQSWPRSRARWYSTPCWREKGEG